MTETSLCFQILSVSQYIFIMNAKLEAKVKVLLITLRATRLYYRAHLYYLCLHEVIKAQTNSRGLV